MNIKICQLASGHAAGDERILYRMARSADEFGYESVYALPTDGSYQDSHVRIVPVPLTPLRLGKCARLMNLPRLGFWILRNRMALVQLHDPDLLPLGLLLRLFGRKVIYDVHDDYEASLKDRLVGRPILRKWVPTVFWMLERMMAGAMSGLIVADRHLEKKFGKLKPVVLGNFPRMDFTAPADPEVRETFNILYVGGVTEARGVEVVLEAIQGIEDPDLRFHVIGTCRDENLLARLEAEPRVVLHGRVPWLQLHHYYETAHLGVAIYQPLESFMYCPGENAVKILEYMAAGIPVLCSDFPGLRRFVEDQGVGRTVRPDSVEAVRSAILELMRDPEARLRLGRTGRARFEEEYNWERHQDKLKNLYRRVLEKK